MAFSLSGAMAGLGKGLGEAGGTATKILLEKSATFDLDKEREAANVLKEAARNRFTTSERVAGEAATSKESGLERSMKERHQTQNVEKNERNLLADSARNTIQEMKIVQAQLANDPDNPAWLGEMTELSSKLKRINATIEQKTSGKDDDPLKFRKPGGGKADAAAPAKQIAAPAVEKPKGIIGSSLLGLYERIAGRPDDAPARYHPGRFVPKG